jgi:hypothetical protein
MWVHAFIERGFIAGLGAEELAVRPQPYCPRAPTNPFGEVVHDDHSNTTKPIEARSASAGGHAGDVMARHIVDPTSMHRYTDETERVARAAPLNGPKTRQRVTCPHHGADARSA